MLVIIGRKFGIAFASLMFRGNPSFQLAVILIVLFASFTFQVATRPFMSRGEYPVVMKQLHDYSEKADEDEAYDVYRDVYQKVSENLRIETELVRKEKLQRHKMGSGFWEDSKAAAKAHDQRSVAEKYFFDLNAVEAILIGCAIIMSLSGIMFQSNYLNYSADNQWETNLVEVLVIIVLFGSLAYYMLVFINEFFPVAFSHYCGRLFLRYQDEGVTREELDRMKERDVVLDSNPLFAASGPIGDQSRAMMKELENAKEALARARRQNDELNRLRSELSQTDGAMTAQNPLALRELMKTTGGN